MTKQTSVEELGRRAVACKHWRWMPGMLVRMGDRSLRCDVVDLGRPAKSGSKTIGSIAIEEWEYLIGTEPTVPDLSDPATLGCLLALVEEAYGACDLNGRGHPSDLGFTHRVYPYDHDACFEGKTRAEALVAALEAAP